MSSQYFFSHVERPGQRPRTVTTLKRQLNVLLIRTADIALSLVIIAFLLPLLALIALLIVVTDPGPVIFKHSRIGQGGRLFRCYKFRSMAVNAEQRLAELLKQDPAARQEWARYHKLKDDPRITAIGKFLRKSSLDELPQLFNVLKGEMSLVGPRPIVLAEIGYYGRYFNTYCSVRPGITGLWQVSGRSLVSYRRRVALDVTYVRAHGLGLYMKVLAKTFPAVLSGYGSC